MTVVLKRIAPVNVLYALHHLHTLFGYKLNLDSGTAVRTADDVHEKGCNAMKCKSIKVEKLKYKIVGQKGDEKKSCNTLGLLKSFFPLPFLLYPKKVCIISWEGTN
jgi:hypothetical protein